jgi:hypothetical protein
MRWAGDVAHMGETRKGTKFWTGNMKGRHEMGDVSVEGRVILK